MADELHDVVKLLLARMESHPEEFGGDLVASGSLEERWWAVVREVREYGTEAECKAIESAMRKIKMQRAHELMMDELCNGEERRRKQREEDEYERALLAQQQAAMPTYQQGTMANSMGARLRSTLAPALDEISSYTSVTPWGPRK